MSNKSKVDTWEVRLVVDGVIEYHSIMTSDQLSEVRLHVNKHRR